MNGAAANPSAHIESAERLLNAAEQMLEKNVTREPVRVAGCTVLAALTHAVIAHVKIEMEKRL